LPDLGLGVEFDTDERALFLTYISEKHTQMKNTKSKVNAFEIDRKHFMWKAHTNKTQF